MAKAQNHRPVEFASHLLTDHQSFGICQMAQNTRERTWIASTRALLQNAVKFHNFLVRTQRTTGAQSYSSSKEQI